jgi:hypothetical protein
MRFWLSGFILFAACSSKDAVQAPAVTDYLPMKMGANFLYAVDSVVTNQNTPVDYSYQLNIQVIDSFVNADGGYTYTLQRSKRGDASAAWSPLSSWSVRATAFQAVVTEGNTSFIKIAGPLTNGKAWDGNGLNDLGGTDQCLSGGSYTCDIYTIAGFGVSYSVPQGLSFPNSLTVMQSDNEDLIVFQDKRSEVYALKTGLVYREIIQYHYCTDSGCLGQQQIDQGLQYHQTLIGYGGL